MGLFGRIFGSDPAKDLVKAKQALARDPARAMSLARRLLDGELESEARPIIEQAREALIAKALEMAREAEESEYFEDAAEWLDRALEQIEDEARQGEIRARRLDLLERAEQALEEPFDAEDGDDPEEPTPFAAGAQLDAFIDMMSDEVAPLYRQQGEEFRDALALLLDGESETALEAFDALVAAAPDDPACRLERGRGKVLAEDLEGARDDFAAAWEGLGDTPLFAGRAESVPGLWADAQLSLGDPGPVIERLAELADPDRRRSDLAVPYATALVKAERLEEAEAYLRHALRRMPRTHDLSYLYAGVLLAGNDRDSAIAVLEAVVAPACAGGTCRPAALHLPSLRTLVALHESGGDEKRARELSVYLASAGAGGADTEALQPDRSATII